MHRHLFISVLRLFSLLGTALAQSYVEPPAVLGQIPTPIVPYTFRPTKVYSTSGTVANAGGLVKPSGPSGRNGSFSSAKLSPNSSIVLDFSLNVGGYPVFEFAPGTSNESPTIQYTVSESLAALELGVGDGYLYLGNPGARYRSEVIPVSGRGERRLGTGIQGAQRFMLIEHIDGTADVSINEVGFQAVTDVTSISDLPGSFNSSDEYLNELWVAGARTVQLGCTGKGSLTPIWHVSAIGTLIESKNIAIHQRSQNWGLVDFSLSLYIISGSIFTVNKGDQCAPDPGATVFYLKAGNNGSGTFSRYNGVEVGSMSYGAISPDGLFGFSAGNDTAIIVKNLVVQDLHGNALYSNSLTSQSAMGDFATGTNSYSVCFDGAKRDRVVWAGDFSIFGPTVFYSTANVEAVSGSL